MKLPENLVKQFVKATKDDAPKKTEYYVYGTAHVVDNHIDVIFDGAKEPTPCTSSVTVEDGDRVMVMIKDRQAMITSNVSKPTINADYLEAGEAKISGTIHAARYEDTTGNFTMDIGGEPLEDAPDTIAPSFKIGGYLNGDPTNDYVELEITIYKLSVVDLPQLIITASVKDNPDAEEDSHVSINVGNSGISFDGGFHDGETYYSPSTSFPWEYHPYNNP